jgi:hypothetical protein
MTNSGNDVEDFEVIRRLYAEASKCQSVSNVQYSVLQNSNNEAGAYQTFINQNGLFCMGSDATRCPNYQVSFCCPLTQQVAVAQCGYTYQPPNLRSSSLRIVNGFQAIPHSFPWAVSLQYKGVHDCGGVIVDQWNILTAAHCLDYSNDLSNYKVRVGAHDRSSSGRLISIAQLIIHPNYDENRSTNDIGIIKLAEPITFTTEIQPICLVDNVCMINKYLIIKFCTFRLLNHHLVQLFMLLVGVVPYMEYHKVQVQFSYKLVFGLFLIAQCILLLNLKNKFVLLLMVQLVLIMGLYSLVLRYFTKILFLYL